MHEEFARTLYYFQIHLLYASMVGFVALALTSIHGGSATTKYWIWVATAFNFFLPVGALLDKLWATHLSWASPLGAVGQVANTISRGWAATALGVVWLFGTTLMFARLCVRIQAERRGAQTGASHEALDPAENFLVDGIPVRFSSIRQAPVVDGVLHPHISLPKGIGRLLSAPELDAVLVHELIHARRRDNLIRLVFEVGLCGLWFHPLVWIAGSRLTLYRELSCDESVIQNAYGGDLVSALAKFANADGASLLHANASSLLSDRLARLTAPHPQPTRLAASALLTMVFSAALLAGVFGIVAHTACCFVAR